MAVAADGEPPLWLPVGLSTITNAITQGSGSALAEAYAALADVKGLLEDWDYQEWQSAIEEAKAHPDAMAEYAATQFAFFQNNNHNIVPDYFDRIMGQDGIGEAQEVVYGDELRDLIAAGMDLDWRNNAVDRETVDFIMEQMFEEAGIDADERETTPITVTVIPYIYADERDGWATGALFAVDGPDEDIERTVTGGGRTYTVAETDPHEFVIDGGVIANLASQADSKGTTIDAITKEQPWKFDSVKHFQDKNYLAEEGLLYLPYELGEQYGLEMDLFGASADSDVRVGTTAAAIETTGEKVWKWVDRMVTAVSVAAMFVPVGGLVAGGLLKGASVGLRAAGFAKYAAGTGLWAERAANFGGWITRSSKWLPGTITPQYAALWGSTFYTAGRGAALLGEMSDLGMDIGWSNPMARSIYVEMLGSAAGLGAMAGSLRTQRLLAQTGPGFASTGARAAYWGTQAGNAVDLGTGGWLTLDGLRQLALAGEDASAWDELMTAMGGGMLTMGAVGMRQDSRSFNNHLNQSVKEYVGAAIDTTAEHLWRQDGKPKGAAAAYRPKATEKLFAPLVDQRTQHHWHQAGKPGGGSEIYRDQALNEVYQITAEHLAQDGAQDALISQGSVELYNASVQWVEQTRSKVPNVNVKKITLGTILLRAIADTIGLSSGHWGRYNAVGGKFVAELAYARSSGSKLAWYDRNHGMIDVYELAAKGRTEDAKKKLDKIEGRTRFHGAAPSIEAEARDLRASLERVGQAGEDYQSVLNDLSPELKGALPEIAIRKMFAPDKTVERWLPKNLENVPDVPAILAAMKDDKTVEYYGKNKQTRKEFATKLDRLTADELDGLPKGGDLTERLSNTLEARQSYRALHKLLCDELGKTDDGRVNHRGAEKKLSSSMSPDNWLGLIFKGGSFVGALNILLAWAHKGTPVNDDLLDWLAYWGDVVQAGPVIVIQKLYLETLQEKREFLTKHPAPRSDDEEKEFQKLEAKRKLLNTLADYTSFFSGLRSVFVGIAYVNHGEYGLGVASLLQAVSSFGWVAVQQTPNIDRTGTYLVEAFKHLNQGDIGLAIPAFKEARKSFTGAAGQQTPEWLKISPKTKAGIRWGSIACGLIVPTLVLIEEILSDTDEKGPSVSQRIYNGLEALVNELSDQPADTSPLTVVTTEEGLNLRTQPSPELANMTALMQGSFVDGTENRRIGGADAWVSVCGFGTNGPQYEDWASTDFVDVRSDGDPHENGRINPELDLLGYRWVEAKAGDNMRLIAVSHSADVAETVMLNMDHIFSPGLIYPGDRIYLPGP
jgi:hypothetical protein